MGDMFNMTKMLAKLISITNAAMILYSCSGPINSNYNSHFTEEGYLIKDSTLSSFTIKQPSRLKFYVEVSGSMNGFFRANVPTIFKADLWQIISYYSPIASEINVLTNDGTDGGSYTLSDFQTKMNKGDFQSTASTKVPLMLKTIFDNTNVEDGEVAVLISDMKYSPVGQAAPEVLLTQYSTDISKVLGDFGESASLICATSNYRDKKGSVTCERSPYYYLVIGKPDMVAGIRNGISTLLANESHFIDNIETGFNFGAPTYTFGIPNKCEQMEGEPTFIRYEEAEDGDTCTVKLKVNIESYRWLFANEQIFKSALKVDAKYGTKLRIDNIKIDVSNITDRQLSRKATATVDLKIYDMVTDSEVIEWSLDLPDTNYSLFNEFFVDAFDENDPTKSYSVKDFIKGMFYGGLTNKALSPNYILISKNH